jgi:uncharacterized membrane protein YqjE
MPTRAEAGAEGGVAGAAKQVAQHARTIVELEKELAQVELQGKVADLGRGAVLGAAAAIMALFALGFLLATAAVALDSFLPLWLALLIVAAALLLAVVFLAAAARDRVQRGSPPVPELALAEAKLTADVLKAHGDS